jgi:DNA polymerase-3 subunit alpha
MHGQNDLFGGAAIQEGDSEQVKECLPTVPAWTHSELLASEKNAIGFFVTGHPLDDYQQVLDDLGTDCLLDLIALGSGAKVKIGGIISSVQVRTTKKGARFGLLRLEDESGGIKVVAWPEVFSRTEKNLTTELAVLVSGTIEIADDGGVTLVMDDLSPLDNIRQRKASAMIVSLPEHAESEPLLKQLFDLFDEHKGDCDVLLDMFIEGGVLVRVRPHASLRVRGSHVLEEAIRTIGCSVEWRNPAMERNAASGR